VGSEVGRDLPQNDFEPLDRGSSATKTCRTDWRCIELCRHQPEPGRHAPPHSRGAPNGATREEILLVLKMASVKSIDGCMLATPLLLEEASEGDLDAAGVVRAQRLKKVNDA